MIGAVLGLFGLDPLLTNPRQFIAQSLNFGLLICSAFSIWSTLIFITGSESPIVVVLSESMSPAFERGDILFLAGPQRKVLPGDICVFKLEGRDIPIVHRVLKLHESGSGDVKILTKGDNNMYDDRGLYNQDQNWLEKRDLVGVVKGYMPYFGYATIMFSDFPILKKITYALMAIFIMFSREE